MITGRFLSTETPPQKRTLKKAGSVGNPAGNPRKTPKNPENPQKLRDSLVVRPPADLVGRGPRSSIRRCMPHVPLGRKAAQMRSTTASPFRRPARRGPEAHAGDSRGDTRRSTRQKDQRHAEAQAEIRDRRHAQTTLRKTAADASCTFACTFALRAPTNSGSRTAPPRPTSPLSSAIRATKLRLPLCSKKEPSSPSPSAKHHGQPTDGPGWWLCPLRSCLLEPKWLRRFGQGDGHRPPP